MLGILGNYPISDRIFQAIDHSLDGLISLEEYLVYNDTLSYGSPTEKNLITFKIIDVQRRGRVNFEEFRDFWQLFIEFYSQVLNLTVPPLDDVNLKYLFGKITQGAFEFDFEMFLEAKAIDPVLFDLLE